MALARLPSLLVVTLALSYSSGWVRADAAPDRNHRPFTTRFARTGDPPLPPRPLPPTRPRGGGDAAASLTAKVASRGVLWRISRAVEGLAREGPPSPKDTLFLVVALASVGLSAAAMVLEAGLLIDCLAWSCAVLGPSAAILQRKVSLLEGLRAITNQLREEVNEVAASNAVLRAQNQRLSKNAKKLKNVQASLEQISSAQGISVDKLVGQVNEYREIQESIKADLRSKIRQTLLDVFMRSDCDQDFVIDPEEVDRLVLGLSCIPSVEFDEATFRKAIKRDGGDISKFLERHLGAGVDPGKDGIFKF